MERTNHKDAIIICAKKRSRRFPGKHHAIYNGLPLFIHTFNFVDKFGLPVYLYTDDEIIINEADDRYYNIIYRPEGQHYKEPSMDMMIFLHEKLKKDVYIMFPLTSPNREITKIKTCYDDFLKNKDFPSATTLKKVDRSNYKTTGAFWFFRSEQVYKNDLIDEYTKYYLVDSIDVDERKDLNED